MDIARLLADIAVSRSSSTSLEFRVIGYLHNILPLIDRQFAACLSFAIGHTVLIVLGTVRDVLCDVLALEYAQRTVNVMKQLTAHADAFDDLTKELAVYNWTKAERNAFANLLLFLKADVLALDAAQRADKRYVLRCAMEAETNGRPAAAMTAVEVEALRAAFDAVCTRTAHAVVNFVTL